MPVRIDYFKKLCELCQAFGTARNRRELLEMIFTERHGDPGGQGRLPVSDRSRAKRS